MNFVSKVSGFVLLAALSSASMAQTVPYDVSFEDLAWTKKYEAHCSVSFPSGEIVTTQAFNQDRQAINQTVIITGRTRDPLTIGERLYARNLDGTAYRAIVLAAGENTASIAVHRRIIATLFSESGDTIWLSQTPELPSVADARMVTLDQDDQTGVRGRYAELLHCAEQLELE